MTSVYFCKSTYFLKKTEILVKKYTEKGVFCRLLTITYSMEKWRTVMAKNGDFLSHQKKDAHNHLNLGMRYDKYVPWAGFSIPNFPRKLTGLDEMHEILEKYTRPRSASAKDVEDLITMAVETAIEDGVTILEGSADIGFVHHYGSIDKFIEAVHAIQLKFKDKIDFRPELGMGKTFDFASIEKWAPACIESGVFKSIDLYGPEVLDGLEKFKPLFKLAEKNGLKTKAHAGEFSDAKSVKDAVEYFDLQEIQHGIGAAQDKSVMKFLADRKTRLNVCPQSNVMLSAVKSLEAHPIKVLYDAGCNVTIATDDVLFFDKTVSEQCVDLINIGMFSEAEIIDILDKSVID